ncbi:MAG TPA: hypothetical protein VE870_00795 [Bacteroidales bacterium]|nr:hypothetical protein [Bacteroidales bacterium]
MIIRHSFILYLIFLLVLMAPGCTNHQATVEKKDLAVSTTSADEQSNVRLIFYNMYLPPKMSEIFQKVGANYNPNILNQPDNFARYQDPHKIALNLGVYGVDLNYARMFNQSATTARYLTSIQLMTEKLGIPSSYFESLMNDMEHYYSNKDSITKIVTGIYERTDSFLKDNNHDAWAALIVTGGWVEALYISTRILRATPDNVEISDRIAEQKYSLNSLISLLSNYQDNIDVAGDLLMLKLLKKSFDRFDIYYDQDDFSIDTVTKVISTSDYHSGITPGILDEITDILSEIRVQMIN